MCRFVLKVCRKGTWGRRKRFVWMESYWRQSQRKNIDNNNDGGCFAFSPFPSFRTCHESFDKHLGNESDSNPINLLTLASSSSSVSSLHLEMNDAARACSSRSSNELFMTSSASVMLLQITGMKNIITGNRARRSIPTWLKSFALISFCLDVCQLLRLVTILSSASAALTTCDEENFWNSFCWQRWWTMFPRFGQIPSVSEHSLCNWTASAMKCDAPTAVWSVAALSVAASSFSELCRSRNASCASLTFDGNRCRYPHTRWLETANLTISAIRMCQKFAWMARCKLNSSANGLSEKLNRHLICFVGSDDLRAQSNAILHGLSLIYEPGAAMIYVFGYRRTES